MLLQEIDTLIEENKITSFAKKHKGKLVAGAALVGTAAYAAVHPDKAADFVTKARENISNASDNLKHGINRKLDDVELYSINNKIKSGTVTDEEKKKAINILGGRALRGESIDNGGEIDRHLGNAQENFNKIGKLLGT